MARWIMEKAGWTEARSSGCGSPPRPTRPSGRGLPNLRPAAGVRQPLPTPPACRGGGRLAGGPQRHPGADLQVQRPALRRARPDPDPGHDCGAGGGDPSLRPQGLLLLCSRVPQAASRLTWRDKKGQARSLTDGAERRRWPELDRCKDAGARLMRGEEGPTEADAAAAALRPDRASAGRQPAATATPPRRPSPSCSGCMRTTRCSPIPAPIPAT